MNYNHVAHPRLVDRKNTKPVKVSDNAVGFNGKLAMRITKIVGSMWCAYAFGLFDLLSLPSAMRTGIQAIVAWVAQTFLQLVLLSIIMVGQNLQSAASDRRAEQTYNDAEMILHECLELHRHLDAQDQTLKDLIKRIELNGSSPTN
ncbi:DUF1003 domain-containing protein [Acidithrix ferrooxidans]|uniref:DUF1003 domain-containing protein n=1 Tax=Acidithrix ferrooxidans TaxID=1280514 RepID=A0A0D8HH71_9ACTN|nr:DUF1003 domain-containing protein [Acidithrix ferrooxidans]KJF17204.1 hypothetical protein AXFE_19170 [Acidithrix ferrooxidans]